MFRVAQDKSDEGYEVNLVRCEHKREEIKLPDGTVLYPMAAETKKLREIAKEVAPDITIIHNGLNSEGSAYINPLPVLEKGSGMNIVVVPSGKLQSKIGEFANQLTRAAKDGNLSIISVSEKVTGKESPSITVGHFNVSVATVKASDLGFLSAWAIENSLQNSRKI